MLERKAMVGLTAWKKSFAHKRKALVVKGGRYPVGQFGDVQECREREHRR